MDEKVTVSNSIKKGDLTVGNPFKVLLRFALPLLLSMIFQQLYSLADNIVAGNMGGANSMVASAAINASSNIVMIFIAFAVGGTTGASVIISRYFGQHEYKATKTAIYTAIISLSIMAGVITLIGVFTSRPLLELLNTTPDIIDAADKYLQIYIYGFFFLFIYNIANSISTGLGDSKTPLILLIISSVSNIICDVVFALIFDDIIMAVAWATFLCQGVVSIIAIVLLLRKVSKIKTDEKNKYFSASTLLKMVKVAIPSILQQSFISVGNLLIQSLIMSFGITEMFTGFGIALKINSLITLSVVAMSNAISTFTAQNLGILDVDRIKKGFIDMMIISEGFILICTIIMVCLPKEILGLFISGETDGNRDLIIEYGTQFIYVVAPFYCAVSFKIICDGLLKGSQNMVGFTVCTFMDLGVRVMLAYVLVPAMQFNAICWSFSIGWSITMLVSLAYTIAFFKKTRKRIKEGKLGLMKVD